jgi:hypothetical protein
VADADGSRCSILEAQNQPLVIELWHVNNDEQALNITQLPFNELIGLELAGPEADLMVGLPAAPQYLNHLGTVHASALLAVVEAGSGEFLLRNFGHIENLVPVVRKLEARFRKPASGSVTSRCSLDKAVLDGWMSELQSRGRVSATLPVDVVDTTGSVVLSAVVEWLITQPGKHA